MTTNTTTFFSRRALLILVVIFFFIPFALRGARLAVQGMKNDVKDWLPKDFPETAELDWFRQHFLGEQFVVVSWEGCHGDEADDRYKLFMAKLMPEQPPRVPADPRAPADEEVATATLEPTADGARAAVINLDRKDFIGDRLGLYTTARDYLDWGGRQEKWLKGNDGTRTHWYYLTPEGKLFRWTGVDSPLAALWHGVAQRFGQELTGELIKTFDPVEGGWFYENPRRLRAQLFKSVTSGPMVLANLTREHTGVLRDDGHEAMRRLSGIMYGPDERQTCMILTLSDAAKRDLHQVVGRGMLGRPLGRLYEIGGEINIRSEMLRLGGPPVDNVAIDEEGTITLVRLVGYSAILGLVLSMICFRSILATIMVLFVGALSAILSLASVYWLGSSVDAILMSMPSLVYVLGLSGAAHIMNYYYSAVDDIGHAGAPERAIAHAWKPALLCNITTAIGLGSLYTSELIPIRKFGLFSALGVMATLIILFTYLPASLQLWPQSRRAKSSPRTDVSWMDRVMGQFWEWLGGFCIKHHWGVAIGCTLVIAGFGYGVTRVQTSVNMLKMFHSEAKIIQDYTWLETHLGRLMPMEVVLKVPPHMHRDEPVSAANTAPKSDVAPDYYGLSFLERMEMVDRVQKVVESEFGPYGLDVMGRTMSAATFAPEMPAKKGGTPEYTHRMGFSSGLLAHRDDFLNSDYLRVDEADGSELWRISLRIAATKGVDYGGFVNELKTAIEPVMAAYQKRAAILRQVVESREGKQPAGARILLLGLPQEALRDPIELAAAAAELKAAEHRVATESAAGDEGDPEADSKDTLAMPLHAPDSPAPEETVMTTREAVASLNQTKIFGRTLYDLLLTARMRVKSHGPSQAPPAGDWAKYLKKFDCVVMVSDSACDPQLAQEHATLFVDVRDHVIQPEQVQPGAFRPVVAAAAGTQPAAAVYTGLVPIVYKAQRTLLVSLIESTFWSFLTITPLMILISRNIAGGLLSMLPNVLPVLMVFGGMGWFNIDVDVGSMMTASIALGVAVDDTIHYLTWFRHELDRLKCRKAAILATYRHCATPTFQAAIISGLGLSVFALSTFTPTQRFGCLMLVILWLGMVAELVFFPALLAGPLGAVFRPRGGHDKDQPEAGAPIGDESLPTSQPDGGPAISGSAVPQPASFRIVGHAPQRPRHAP